MFVIHFTSYVYKIMLVISNLVKKYGEQTAVDNLSLELSGSFILGLVGRNGCGKTTFFRMLLGLTPPTSGTCSLMNETDPENYRRHIGVLLDDVGFDPGMSAKSNLQVFGKIADVPYNDILEQAKYFDIANQLGKRVGKYSLGMKRRLGLAALFSKHYPLYILDEPSNGLDIDGQQALWAKIKEKHEEGSRFIITSHILADVEGICNYLAVLDAGKLIFNGTMEEARQSGPLHQLIMNRP